MTQATTKDYWISPSALHIELNALGYPDYIQASCVSVIVSPFAHFIIVVYDTASWMAITCLSEQSAAMGGMPVPVPDFTNGMWIDREPYRKGTYCLEEVCAFGSGDDCE